MEAFDGISFLWSGRTVTIPPYRLLGALARLEESIALDELASGRASQVRVAKGLASVLRFAGVAAEAEAVYAALITDAEVRAATNEALALLLASAAPPQSLRRKGSGSASQPRLVDALFKAVVGNGWATARDFAAMTPHEAWLMLEARTPPRMATKTMTQDDADALYERTYGTEEAA